MAFTVSVWPIRLAGLLALINLAQEWQQARAQNVVPLEPELFTRPNVRVVCAGRCPDTLNRYDASPQDKVVWKQGPPTLGGRIEIRCGEYHHCTVFQDDRRVHPNVGYGGDWEQVSYMELAPPAKP